MISPIRLCGICLLLLWQCGSVATAQTSGAGLPARFRTLFVERVDSNQYVGKSFVLQALPIGREAILAADARTGYLLDTSYFRLVSRTVVFVKPYPSAVRLTYRGFPPTLTAAAVHKDTTFWRGTLGANGKRQDADGAYRYNPSDARSRAANSLADLRGLTYQGSFARGISVGNAQDLVLNSSFNLQLSGKLADDLDIRASLADNNVPIQPQGNTQSLQQFDKIFVEIRRRQTILKVGDIEYTRPPTYFLNANRRLQGLQIATALRFPNDTDTARSSVLNVSATAAVAKGKFNRLAIQGTEGNQGPYRLTGANGETFIIVLAGTERVYADGRLLTRGIENEYTVDYNRGEITFTAKKLITKDTRLTIEYSYLEQNYLRFVEGASVRYTSARLKMGLHLYAEQDQKNNTGANALTNAQQAALREAGDSTARAIVSGIDTLKTAFDKNQILYYRKDTTTTAGIFRGILAYATTAHDVNLVVHFSEVGQGKGNYVLAPPAANGRVYLWVAPDSATGKPRGNYEPVQRIAAPTSQFLAAFNVEYKLSKRTSIRTEFAVSNRNNNLYSDLDKADDTGAAARFDVLHEQPLESSQKGRNAAILTAQLGYEYVASRFTPVEAYRAIEFTRDWNTANLPKTDEQWLTATASVRKPTLGAFTYTASGLWKATDYVGIRNAATLAFERSGFSLNATANLLTSEGRLEHTDYWHPRIEAYYGLPYAILGKYRGLKIGAVYETERNARRSPTSDSLRANSFWFDLYRAYVATPDTAKQALNFAYQRRIDYLTSVLSPTAFHAATSAEEITLGGSRALSRTLTQTQTLKWNLTYRRLTVGDTALERTQKPQETYLGRIDYSGRFLKDAVTITTTYELGTGQEQRISYTYLEVAAGQGTYAWFDRNGDGIKQLNEFELSAFHDQAKFVRVTTYTGQYVRSNTLNLSQSLQLAAPVSWRGATKGWRKFAARFGVASTLQLNRKTLPVAGLAFYNPYLFNLPDTALVALNQTLRHQLSFNRTNAVFGADFTLTDFRQKTALAQGSEERTRAEQLLHVRYAPAAKFLLETDLSNGTKTNTATLFVERDYLIAFHSVQMKTTWQPSPYFRSSLALQYRDEANQVGANERLSANDVSVEAAYSKSGSATLRSKVSLVRIAFDGASDSSVGYAMLEGLQRGDNLIWSLTLERQLTKALQLSVGYDGRRTGSDSPTVHTGRVQIRMIF